MSLPMLLGLPMVLLAVSGYAITASHRSVGSRRVYGIALFVCIISLMLALAHLLAWREPATIGLPLGLPWLGAHFRLDALAAYFLVVVNLGGAVASPWAARSPAYSP